MNGFDDDGIERLNEAISSHVESGHVGGLTWAATRDGDVRGGSAGVLTRGGTQRPQADSQYRIMSMTKPVVAVAALTLIEAQLIRLDEPVDRLLPELADRRVLLDPQGPLDGQTAPALRPIAVRDLLTCELGLGIEFSDGDEAFGDRLRALGLRGPGGIFDNPPQLAPGPDEWIRRMGTFPLRYQPGQRWLYDTGSDMLGVLLARASGQRLDEVLEERVLAPLGMRDTGFSASPDRLGSCYGYRGANAEPVLLDPPAGQWSTMPAFPSGAAGLVSTASDMLAFGQMLLAGGRSPDGSNLVSTASTNAMTTNQINAQPGSGPACGGWGYGIGVQTGTGTPTRRVGSYGWHGSLGTEWLNDPTERLCGVVMTTDQLQPGAPTESAISDFWTYLFGALISEA